MDVLLTTVEKHPKSIIVKQAKVLVDTLLQAFDLRRMRASKDTVDFSAKDIEELENTIQDLTIKMILKLNDTAFRPIFTKFIAWATHGLPKKHRKEKVLRMTTIYKLLGKFFGTLKVRNSIAYSRC